MKKANRQKPFAKKSLGQNFLVDRNYIERIISSLNLTKNDLIVEIGAGRGALTEKLVERAGKVLAIELDRDLIPVLQAEFKDYENFFLIEQDALEVDFEKLIKDQSPKTEDQTSKLVANLPYYISTAILQHLIQYRNSFSELVLMLQKEVVERITAEAGNKERGFLTVLIEAYFETSKLFDVPPNAFRPVPKVTSAVLRLLPKKNGQILDEKLFRELVSLGFRQKRKTILNNLKNADGDLKERFDKNGGIIKILADTQIEIKQRAESLSIEDWLRIYKITGQQI